MTKNQTIAASILAEVQKQNGDVRAALNALFGEGFYDQFAGDLYDQLRARG